jgi:hypothetical protein
MLSQETLFYWFCHMKNELHNEGYPILNDLRHEFPGVMREEDIYLENFLNGWNSDEEDYDEEGDDAGDSNSMFRPS